MMIEHERQPIGVRRRTSGLGTPIREIERIDRGAVELLIDRNELRSDPGARPIPDGIGGLGRYPRALCIGIPKRVLFGSLVTLLTYASRDFLKANAHPASPPSDRK